MASSKAPQAADESSSKKGRVNLAALTAHTFEEVTAARGERWAEGTIKALQQKERAQAVQIMELKRELEAAKAQAAKREAKKKSDEPIEAADEGAPPEAEQDGPSELELLRQHAESLAAELAQEKELRQSDAERMREEAAAECRTERERLGERYEQRLHTATAVQRSLEERLREQQQQLAAAQQLLAEQARAARPRHCLRQHCRRLHSQSHAAMASVKPPPPSPSLPLAPQARPPSVETRREHAATQRENEALRAEVRRALRAAARVSPRLASSILLRATPLSAPAAISAQVEGLRDECAQLRQRLSGFNGKLQTLKDEFAQSERQASEEERQLALMLREAHSEKNGLYAAPDGSNARLAEGRVG